jgi:hypothetical protein
MDGHNRHGFEDFFAVSIFAYRGEGGMSLVWVTSAGKKDTLDASP